MEQKKLPGIVFDIDGVIKRGSKLLPNAEKVFKIITQPIN